MKELLIVKRIDLGLQVLAFIIPFVWAVAAHELFIILFAYFSVGGVQVLSCVLNKLGWNPNLKHNGRGRYEKLLLIVLVVEGMAFALARFTEHASLAIIAKAILCALPFFSPLMAIWYMAMTREELVLVRRLSQRRVI